MRSINPTWARSPIAARSSLCGISQWHFLPHENPDAVPEELLAYA
jgi:hypothetical protein